MLHYVGDDPRRGELGLEVCQVLTFVGSEPGDVDQADHVVSRAGGGDDRAAVGVADEQDRPVDLLDNALEVLAVAAAQTAQRVRRSDDGDLFAHKFVVRARRLDASAKAPWTRTMVGPAM